MKWGAAVFLLGIFKQLIGRLLPADVFAASLVAGRAAQAGHLGCIRDPFNDVAMRAD
jgi:hypothetical protein